MFDKTEIGNRINMAIVIVRSSHQRSASTRAPGTQGKEIFDAIRIRNATMAHEIPMRLALDMSEPLRTGLWQRVSVMFLAAVVVEH